MGIAVLHDNPNVGDHLNDHQGLNYTYRMNGADAERRAASVVGQAAGRDCSISWPARGPLSLSINHGGGFFRTRPDLPRPNMQLYFQAFSTLIPREGERPILSPDPFSGMSIGLSNCRPTSRGHVRIALGRPAGASRHHRERLFHEP